MHIFSREVVLRLVVHVEDAEPLSLLGGFYGSHLKQYAAILATAEAHIYIVKRP
jgi:hypothetical protein